MWRVWGVCTCDDDSLVSIYRQFSNYHPEKTCNYRNKSVTEGNWNKSGLCTCLQFTFFSCLSQQDQHCRAVIFIPVRNISSDATQRSYSDQISIQHWSRTHIKGRFTRHQHEFWDESQSDGNKIGPTRWRRDLGPATDKLDLNPTQLFCVLHNFGLNGLP